jgi:hypothetical protein
MERSRSSEIGVRPVIYRLVQGIAAMALVFVAVGASCNTVSPNVYTPLTDAVTVAVINATPYRAIFTLGAYENLDQNTIPDPTTVLLESQANDPTDLGTAWMLTTAVSAFPTPACRRAVSIGDPGMIKRINDNLSLYEQVGLTIDKRALVTGVYFSDAPLGSPDEANPTRGTADPFTALQGVDYPCGSVLVLRLVEDAAAAGGFSVKIDGVIF